MRTYLVSETSATNKIKLCFNGNEKCQVEYVYYVEHEK